MTFFVALRHDRGDAPWLIDGPVNGERFRLYVEQVLAPTLCPDDFVIMDNFGSHKGKAVGRAIRATGAHLFPLPKYTSDLNRIEMPFSKLKHWLREAAGRNIEAVRSALKEILNAIASAECRNYFIEAGYDRT
jgi:transposase